MKSFPQSVLEIPFEEATCQTAFWNEPNGFGVSILSNNAYYAFGNNIIAHKVKDGDKQAIRVAARSMRSVLHSWENVALVPVPSHQGYATYTLELARAIGKGRIFDILKCQERETLYSRKQRGEQVTAESLGFYTVGRIPEHMHIVFIDNVVATGTTAKAARAAVGRGAMVAFAVDTTTFLK